MSIFEQVYYETLFSDSGYEKYSSRFDVKISNLYKEHMSHCC